MATIRERLIYAIELVTDRAQAGVKGFRQAVSEADGTVNKFKAGASSAMATVAANAGTLAIAGGAALVTFGAKAVKATQEVRLEAGKLADATGLTVEAASRLREVGADIGVSGETITAVVRKMQVEIGKGNPAVDELGISLQKASDGSADVNATLLDTIKRIQAIENPTKRAAAAQAIFGRGYAQAAELIFTNADKLQQKLDEVSDAKVVTPEELARAREFRDQLEDLKDVGEDLSVSTGQVVIPVLGDLAEILNGIAVAAEEAKKRIEDIPGGGGFLDTIFTSIPDVADEALFRLRELEEGLGFEPRVEIGPLREQFNQIVAAGNEVTDVVDEQGDAVEELGPRWSATGIPLEAASGAFAELGISADAAAESADRQADADERAAEQAEKHADIVERQRDVTKALADQEQRRLDIVNQSLGGALRLSQSQRDARDALFQYNETVKENNEAAPEHKLNEDQMADLVEETALQQIEAADAATQYRIEQAEAAGATVTASDETRILIEELYGLVGTLEGPVRDAVAQAIADLDALARPRTIKVGTEFAFASDVGGRAGDFLAPEVGGQFALNGATHTINVTVNTTGELAPSKIVDAIDKYYRFNSPR